MGQSKFPCRKEAGSRGRPQVWRRHWIIVLLGTVAIGLFLGRPAMAQQVPSPVNHVPELARYLADVQIAAPVLYRGLAVYPLLRRTDPELPGRWLTLDRAMNRGVLRVRELPGGGTVPVVTVENTSRRHYVFLMSGELLAGGKQARSVRHDVIVAPGQRVKLEVFCVEARRWGGDEAFAPAFKLAPPSVQMAIRGGAMQEEVWQRVDQQNRALGADNPTKSLHEALDAPRVKDRLQEARHRIVPRVSEEAVGFLFVYRGRARACELFGSRKLARALLPKLVEAYAVDCIVPKKEAPDRPQRGDQAAIEFFKRVLRASSQHVATAGSGSGIRTRTGGLVGEGVSLTDRVVHYGVQPR